MFPRNGYSRGWTLHDRRLGGILVGLMLTTALPAQGNQAGVHAPENIAGAQIQSRAKSKLTQQQQQGLQLLQGVQVKATTWRPAIRTYVLWLSSQAYAKLNPRKTDSTLRDAFQTNLAVENTLTDGERCAGLAQACDIKGWLQRRILWEMVRRTPHKVEDLLPIAEPGVRKDILQGLIDRCAQKGDLEGAQELLNQFADDERYPSGAASRVMELLLGEKVADRLAIFTAASRNFRQHSGTSKPQLEDFSSMVLRSWQQVSPSAVMGAIDAILEQAKKTDDVGVINSITDPEICVLGETAFANVLLGNSSFSHDEIEWHRDGIKGGMSGFGLNP